MGPTVKNSICQWAQLSMGPTVNETNCRWAQLLMSPTVNGPNIFDDSNCQWSQPLTSPTVNGPTVTASNIRKLPGEDLRLPARGLAVKKQILHLQHSL